MTAEQFDWQADLLDTGAEFILINGERHWAHDAKEIVRLHKAQLAEKERLLHAIVLMVCDPHKAAKGGELPSQAKAVELIIDRVIAAEQRLKEAQRERDDEREAHEKIATILLPLVDTRDGSSVSLAENASAEIVSLRERLWQREAELDELREHCVSEHECTFAALPSPPKEAK